jgi:hypothetical protein
MRLARVRGFVPQDADAVNPFRGLRQDGERRIQCPDSEPAQERAPVHHSKARTTANPISRMGTSKGMAGWSLANECCSDELAALVEHATR